MSRRDIPVCPGDVIICRRSCAEPGSGLFVAHFLPHDVTFSIIRWCQVPPCGGNWRMYMSRSWGQNALRAWPRTFCWSLDTVLLFAKSEYLHTHIYEFTTKNVARVTSTTAILSRMCRQVWVGTFGICRSHARASIPMQTNTLGTSRCTGRYIRHMQTSAPTTTHKLFLREHYEPRNAINVYKYKSDFVEKIQSDIYINIYIYVV